MKNQKELLLAQQQIKNKYQVKRSSSHSTIKALAKVVIPIVTPFIVHKLTKKLPLSPALKSGLEISSIGLIKKLF